MHDPLHPVKALVLLTAIGFLFSGQLSARAISSGESLSGTISSSGQTAAFAFAAVAGDTVQIRMSKAGGDMTPRIELRSPTGGWLSDGYWVDSYITEITTKLTSSGTFTIICKSGNAAIGQYTLSMVRLTGYPLSASDPDIGPINSGESLVGTINKSGDLDTATFAAVAGDTVQIRMSKAGGDMTPRIELHSPTGDWLSDGYWVDSYITEITAKLTSSGTFTIICKSGNAAIGQYTLSMVRLTGYPLSASDPDIGPINSGESLVGTINKSGDLDTATFAAVAGDTVQIRMSKAGGDMTPRIELHSPTGDWLSDGYWVDSYITEITAKLTNSGTFTIICKSGNAAIGQYTLSMVRLTGYPLSASDPDIGPINSGESLVGTINKSGDLDTTTFAAVAGDTVQIRMSKAGGDMTPRIELHSPTGDWLSDGYWVDSYITEITAKLTSSGTFTIICKSGNAATGQYTLSIILFGGNTPEDIDGDGVSNVEELKARTNPFDRASFLGISSIENVPNQGLRLRWQTVGGLRYRVQSGTAPRPSEFADLPRSAVEETETDVPEGQSHWMEYLDTTAGTKGDHRFYRIRLVP